MPISITYPKEPYIGVDCSGQPKSPPFIVVATRNSRRHRQCKWVVRVTAKRINVYKKRYRDWQERLYASLFFRVIDKIFQSNYEIHIDKELPNFKTQELVNRYLLRLFGLIHAGDIEKEKPNICFITDRSCKYVRHADKKAGWARDGILKIDEKEASIDYLMRLLDNAV
jgi:isocitrate dehydrogenase kinase/phosphatase